MSFKLLQKTVKTILIGTIATMLLLAGGFGYAYWIEPVWIDIHSVPITLPRLKPEFQNYRIVQISDIHADEWMTTERLTAIVNRINQLQPDLVAITGDFVTGTPALYANILTTALGQLAPRDLTVAVLGNHDHWSDPDIVRQALEQSSVTNISNAVWTIQRNGTLLHIAGVDDIWTGNDRLDLVLEQLPAEGAAILLVHEPDFADISAATGRFDLQLSGHSHGGQVILPIFGPPKLPPYGLKYPVGRYQIGNMIQYTNRGIGMVTPRIRFNCRPEITLLR
ncbi:MAG: metallophosphoesterase [Cyanobacteria bacterium CRU_2_1]|nr:metallophosphoesterase [Cyanobacteria bacterium CRU_2_1]